MLYILCAFDGIVKTHNEKALTRSHLYHNQKFRTLKKNLTCRNILTTNTEHSAQFCKEISKKDLEKNMPVQ